MMSVSGALCDPEVKRHLLSLDNKKIKNEISNDELAPGDHSWVMSPQDAVFNNHVVLKNIFSYIRKPIRNYRTLTKATNTVVISILKKRKTIRLFFGDGSNAKRFKGNQKIIKKFPVQKAIVHMTSGKSDVKWLANNHASQLKVLILDATVTSTRAFNVFQDLLRNLTNLEELTLSLTTKKELFDNFNFKIESLRKLRVTWIQFDVIEEIGYNDLLEESILYRKLMDCFPNVQELETFSSATRGPFTAYSSWPKLTAFSFKMASTNEVLWKLLNEFYLRMLTRIPQKLEKLKLVGRISPDQVHLITDILERHAPTLESLTLALDTGGNSRIQFPRLPNLKELNLSTRHQFYYWKVPLPSFQWLADEDEVRSFWWPTVFPKLERLRVDLPIFEEFDSYFMFLLPSDPEALGKTSKIPRNETLKTLEIRLPTTEEGDAWIQKFRANFQLYFPNASLLTLTKY